MPMMAQTVYIAKHTLIKHCESADHVKQISGLLFYRYVCHLWYSTTTAVNKYVWLMMVLRLGRAQLMNQYQETCAVLLLGQNNIIMCYVL